MLVGDDGWWCMMVGGGGFIVITVSHPTLSCVSSWAVTTLNILDSTKYSFTTTSKQLI